VSSSISYFKEKLSQGQAWWYVPIILATQKAEVGRSWSEAGTEKIMRSYLKNKVKEPWCSSSGRLLESDPKY
jgi:hypothetical protein